MFRPSINPIQYESVIYSSLLIWTILLFTDPNMNELFAHWKRCYMNPGSMTHMKEFNMIWGSSTIWSFYLLFCWFLLICIENLFFSRENKGKRNLIGIEGLLLPNPYINHQLHCLMPLDELYWPSFLFYWVLYCHIALFTFFSVINKLKHKKSRNLLQFRDNYSSKINVSWNVLAIYGFHR